MVHTADFDDTDPPSQDALAKIRSAIAHYPDSHYAPLLRKTIEAIAAAGLRP